MDCPPDSLVPIDYLGISLGFHGFRFLFHGHILTHETAIAEKRVLRIPETVIAKTRLRICNSLFLNDLHRDTMIAEPEKEVK